VPGFGLGFRLRIGLLSSGWCIYYMLLYTYVDAGLMQL
jgi:hypothetical protein